MTTAIDQLHTLLSPAIESLGQGLVLWGIEYTSGTGSALLRVFIDATERPVTIDDCAAVSREISALLDVEDPIPDNYTLEVSSPGIDRPLFSVEQYEHYRGEIAKLTLGIPDQGRRRLQGMIVRAEAGQVVLDVNGVEHAVPFENIQKAKLVPQYENAAKHSGKQGPSRRKPAKPGAA